MGRKQMFACNSCNKQFTSRRGFTQHMQVHTGRYSYYCDTCRRGFTGKSEYNKHMRAHAGLKYHCEYCSKPFVSKEKLGFHLSVHTGLYKFRCEKCDKGFNAKYEFNRHIVSHATEHWSGYPFCWTVWYVPFTSKAWKFTPEWAQRYCLSVPAISVHIKTKLSLQLTA